MNQCRSNGHKNERAFFDFKLLIFGAEIQKVGWHFFVVFMLSVFSSFMSVWVNRRRNSWPHATPRHFVWGYCEGAKREDLIGLLTRFIDSTVFKQRHFFQVFDWFIFHVRNHGSHKFVEIDAIARRVYMFYL